MVSRKLQLIVRDIISLSLCTDRYITLTYGQGLSSDLNTDRSKMD